MYLNVGSKEEEEKRGSRPIDGEITTILQYIGKGTVGGGEG